MVERFLLSHSSRIDRIRARWNPLGQIGGGGALTGRLLGKGCTELSKAEEPVDTHWTVPVVETV